MEKINNQTKIRFLSIQVKQALFYALHEAKKNKTDFVTLKFIFYGLMKAQPSILIRIINKLYKKGNINTILRRCEKSFKNEYGNSKLTSNSSNVRLSKSVRNLFYDTIRTTKPNISLKTGRENYIVITTVMIFKGLIKNNSFRSWLLDEILVLKN